MATYAEYQQQTSQPMASSSNDFTLYPPYSDVWSQEQSFVPTTSSFDPAFLNATTFDSYQSQNAFIDPALEQYSFADGFQSKAAAYSPAHSSFDYTNPPLLSSTSDSGASVQSTASSAIGSPSMRPQSSNDWHHAADMHMVPGIVNPDLPHDIFATTGFALETIPVTDKGCVDPALIQPYSPPQFPGAHFPDIRAVPSPQPMSFALSPAPSRNGKISGTASPYMRTQTWQPYPTFGRRPSISSIHSRHSHGSGSSGEDSNKGLCPIPTCGRHVKDLKAHMLTHQNERPEKCPIPTCEYHTKGFARKYDKNRHTLTHYKGTMVCGFCPGSGSAAEKSFNRADVFKRHLTSVHGVEQTPPNARRKTPAATTAAASKKSFGNRESSGMCSTCGITFASAQDFYEHLDDCVLRVVQQADPSEAVNERILSSMADDKKVQDTMEKHMLPATIDQSGPVSFDDDEDDEDEDEDDSNDSTYGSRSKKLRSHKSDNSC